MSAAKLLYTALLKTGWVVERDIYRETKNRAESFIVFNLAHERAEVFADNAAKGELAYYQVHIFLPETQNPSAIKKQVKTLLFEAGFSYPETVLDTLERDTFSEAGKDSVEKSGRKRHICLETNITQEMED